jgi:hypothetical protein
MGRSSPWHTSPFEYFAVGHPFGPIPRPASCFPFLGSRLVVGCNGVGGGGGGGGRVAPPGRGRVGPLRRVVWAPHGRRRARHPHPSPPRRPRPRGPRRPRMVPPPYSRICCYACGRKFTGPFFRLADTCLLCVRTPQPPHPGTQRPPGRRAQQGRLGRSVGKQGNQLRTVR